MKLKSLSAAGFRGFNSARSIAFHDHLTLISAPNSHGKTSITEAFEFLFYGQTSKVESADSKDEYKDSYRNRHFPALEIPYIEAVCVAADGTPWTFRAEISGQEVLRYVNGESVNNWPFDTALIDAARPFVVQHDLKRLLLAPPAERFQGFARLLGLQDVDEVQQAIINLCTKPERHLPERAKQLLQQLEIFLGRLKNIKETASIAKALAKGTAGLDEAFERVHSRGERLAGRSTTPEEMSSALVSLRNAAAAKVYAGSVQVATLTTPERQELSASGERIQQFMGEDTLKSYSVLAMGGTADRVRKQYQLLSLGIELILNDEPQCPLCEQSIDAAGLARIHERHEHLGADVGRGPDLSLIRTQLAAHVKRLLTDVSAHLKIQLSRSRDLINANTPESSAKIKALFGKGREHELFLIAAAGAAIRPKYDVLSESAAVLTAAANVCEDALRGNAEDLTQMEALLTAAGAYLAASAAYEAVLTDLEPTLDEPSRLLRNAVDAQAGTTELSLLIEVLANAKGIRKAVRINDILLSLKDLRKHLDQAVGQTMEDAFSTELTGAVMDWYLQIRTSGDPDVHFSGFSMERTKAGDFKNRRVRVSAKSYGVELASAVSSLSESKLNALGLCMSIATALRAPGPWRFLVLDDPIQSWDDDHETQFIQMIRRLAEEEGRQIVLMSHRASWIDSVVAGCRTLNGVRYHISGYTQDGPVIGISSWASVDQRLKEAWGIVSDPAATPVRLQQAEEELRIAACQLAAEVAKAKLNRTVGAHGLNSAKVRSILTEAGAEAGLLDRVVATFTTTDDAHHAPKEYEPNRERIRRYHGALSDLRAWLTKAS